MAVGLVLKGMIEVLKNVYDFSREVGMGGNGKDIPGRGTIHKCKKGTNE